MVGIVFLSLLLFRLTLVDRGLMYWWDERMHWFSLSMWAEIASGDWGEVLKLPFHPMIQGRPAWVVVNMVPAGFQVLAFLIWGIKTETPTSLRIVGGYNALLSIGVLILFWLIAKKMLTKEMALIATIIYALLANSTINVRHMYPIYPALILYLSSFLILLKTGDLRVRELMVAGVLSGLGQLTYASYFLFPIFELVVIFYRKAKVGSFILGYMIPLLVFEGWARLLGTSVYANIARNPGLNPSFFEALTFLPRYLIEAEGKIGLLLLGLSILPLWGLIRYRRKVSLAVMLGITSWLLYGIFALTTLWHHRIYARVIHIFILFLVIGVLGSIKLVDEKIRRVVVVIIGIMSVVSFYSWAIQFQKLVYPWEVRFRLCNSYYACPKQVMEISENSVEPIVAVSEETETILVNSLYLAPIEKNFFKFVPPKNFTLVYSQPHPLNFVPYQLEGYNPRERLWLRQRAYTIRVYRWPD